jgi:hypothetical protein
MLFLLLVTLISLLLAVIMSVIAWRVAREERRRSAARVAALAADIHDPDLDLRRPAEAPASTPGTGLFTTAEQARPTPRLAAVVGIGVLVFGSMAAVAITLGSGAHPTAAGAAPASTPAASPEASQPVDQTTAVPRTKADGPVPLELLALGHERDGDRLTVRGVVRNPVSGAELDRVTAVVFLYNRDGVFLASGREEIMSPTLAPGGESSFTVTVADAADVGRYRISFRTDDRVVPHVDQRERRDH